MQFIRTLRDRIQRGEITTLELLKVAKHGPGRRVFVIDFRYVEQH